MGSNKQGRIAAMMAGLSSRLLRGAAGYRGVRGLATVASALLVSLGCTLLYSASASASTGYALHGSFSPPAGFGEPVGVAVDNSEGPDKGDVYVSDRGKDTVDEFSRTGSLLAQLAFPGVILDEMFVDGNGNVYVAGYSNGVIYKLAPGLTSSEEFIKGLERPTDVVYIGGYNLIFVAEESGKVLQFNPSGEPALGVNVIDDTPGPIHGIASAGSDLYLSAGNQIFRYLISGNTFPLFESVATPDIGPITGVVPVAAVVENAPAGLYADEQAPRGGRQIVAYERNGDNAMPATPSATFGAGILSSRAEGIGADYNSGYVYVADAGNGAIYAFEPAFALTIGTRGATVDANLNPEGEPTSFQVEYGTQIPYESITPPAGVGSGTEPNKISTHLSALRPGVLYHLRLAVTKGSKTTYGGDVTFTTYSESSTALSDGRVYEMITPPAKNFDSEVFEMGEFPRGEIATTFPFQAGLDGNSIAYVAWPTVGGTGSTGIGNTGNEFIAARSPQGGWSTQDITPAGSLLSTQYQAFSPDLSTGIIAAAVEPPFSVTESLVEPPPGTGYTDLFAHMLTGSQYRPLFTVEPPYRSVETEARGAFGSGELHEATEHSPIYAGASTGMARRLFEANDDLLEGHGILEEELASDVKGEVEMLARAHELSEEGRTEEAAVLNAADNRNELYASENGSVSLVNVSAADKVVPDATYGGMLPSTPSGPNGLSLSHVISSDGSRIFWTALEHYPNGGEVWLRPKAIYVREDGLRTVQVSAGPATFWTASSDGRFAFYTEAGRLLRFDVEDESRSELAGASGGVQGVVGVNENGEDGSFVYFVSHESLSGNANFAGQYPVEGANNLYLIETDGSGVSHTLFIGALSPSDRSDWQLETGARTSLLTADGQSLEFAAHENLTGNPYPDEGSDEIYVFDAHDDSIYCASCTAQASGGNESIDYSLLYHYRVISDDGNRVFFDSEESLVPQDVNGTQDVYEWERNGSGECHQSAGCVYLLSDGLNEGKAFFVDASASGDDAFVVTRQRLLPQDENEFSDLYDARVDGVKPSAPPECSGTGCQGPPAPPTRFAAPATETFAGIGNFPAPATSAQKATQRRLTRTQQLNRALAQCQKKHGSRKRRCERQARKRFGGKQSKHAKHATKRGK